MPREIEGLVAEIRYHHRQRVFAMEQRKRADLALGSFLRSQLGWRKEGVQAVNDAARAGAAALIATGEKLAREAARPPEKRRPVEGADDPRFREWAPVIAAAVMARAPFDRIEAAAEKAMGRLAQELPVWPWARDIRGFGAVGLATIVAEAGDLALYAGPAKLWKRMGVGLVDGLRQGGLPRTAGADAWIAHGYNRQRRSRMWNIGDSLIKGNGEGEYRSLYLARKDYERAKAETEGLTVAPAARIPRGRAAEFRSDGHIHRRAQRYMEKRLLRNLWRAWREARADLSPYQPMPPADPLSADLAEGREASSRPPPRWQVPPARQPDAAA